MPCRPVLTAARKNSHPPHGLHHCQHQHACTCSQVETLIETANHGVLVLPLFGKSCSDFLRIGNLTADAKNPYVASICISMLSAIAALARLSLCHADIKPSNIMLPSHKVRCSGGACSASAKIAAEGERAGRMMA